MKRIILSAIALFFFLNNFSQVDVLVETTWYLAEFDYEGVDYTLPGGDPTAAVSLGFSDQGGQLDMSTVVTVDSFFCFVEVDETTSTFITSDPAITLFGCDSFCDLENAYFEFYFKDGNPVTFDYDVFIIDSQEPSLLLVVTDEFGNQANYTDQLLAVDDFAAPSFSIYPNPASETITITSESSPLENIKFYNVLGEMIMQQTNPEITLDVSPLSEGLYFIEFTSEGKKSIQKFIKN